jgi:hypothetical protein
MIATDTLRVPGKAHECPACHREECRKIGSEYGGLAGGGDYDVHKCFACKTLTCVELPD